MILKNKKMYYIQTVKLQMNRKMKKKKNSNIIIMMSKLEKMLNSPK